MTCMVASTMQSLLVWEELSTRSVLPNTTPQTTDEINTSRVVSKPRTGRAHTSQLPYRDARSGGAPSICAVALDAVVRRATASSGILRVCDKEDEDDVRVKVSYETFCDKA